MPGGGGAQAEEKVQKRTAAGTVGADEGDAASRGEGEAALLEEGGEAGKGEAQALGFDGHSAVGGGGALAVLAFDVQVQQVPQFVHGGHEVVPGLEFLSQLGHSGGNSAHDQLGGGELAHGELLVQHEPASQQEDGHAGTRGEDEQTGDLPEEHLEVEAPLLQITAGELVGVFLCEGLAPRAAEEQRKGGNLFKPVNECVFDLRLGNAGLHGSPAEGPDHQGQQAQQRGDKGKQRGVVERQQKHPCQTPDDHVDPVQEKKRGTFLGGHHLQKAVDQLRRVYLIGGLRLDSGQAVGKIRRDANKNASLNDLGKVILKPGHDGLEGDAPKQGGCQNNERLHVGLGSSPKG